MMSASSNYSCNLSDFGLTRTGDEGFFSLLLNFLISTANIYFPTIMVIGGIENTMVIVVILKIKDMLNSTNIFLANLAVADIMVLLLWGAVISNNFLANWIRKLFSPHEVLLVIIMRFAIEVVISTSVLTVLAVGYERYYAICQPLKVGYICTKKRAFRICILAWALATLFCGPGLYIKFFYPCQILQYFLIHSVVFFMLIPSVSLVLFLIILRHLRQFMEPDVNTAIIRHRRQVITMLATVVACYLIFQLPFGVWCLMHYRSRRELQKWLGVDLYTSVFYVCDMLLYLHSAINPILYNLMSQRFRVGFKNICCFCGPRCHPLEIQRTKSDISRGTKTVELPYDITSSC